MGASMESLRHDVRKNPADLEREADRARDAVEHTLHELEQRLSPTELVHRVMDTLKRNGGGFGENLAAQVRSNPVPTVLAGVGVLWLILSSKRAERRDASGRSRDAGWGSQERTDAAEDGSPSLGGRWSSAMDSVHEVASEASDTARGAVSATATAARTAASSMRGAADAMTDAASRTASVTRNAAEAMTQASRTGVQRVTEGYTYLSREQPLVLGGLAVVVGAAIGALLPSTDAEDEWLGDVSDDAKARLKSETHSKANDLKAAANSMAANVQESLTRTESANGDEPSSGNDETPSGNTADDQTGASESAEVSTK